MGWGRHLMSRREVGRKPPNMRHATSWKSPPRFILSEAEGLSDFLPAGWSAEATAKVEASAQAGLLNNPLWVNNAPPPKRLWRAGGRVRLGPRKQPSSGSTRHLPSEASTTGDRFESTRMTQRKGDDGTRRGAGSHMPSLVGKRLSGDQIVGSPLLRDRLLRSVEDSLGV